ncbi:unnamed protein product (mitochondrion) [Plasmodiophora brassicae]|uniref:F-box domain-containing protein n=1 Tax=Plasmodiophora brassicae TaxID=37360 RepID=A0A0G4J0T0_PLABS|nr:hypothetical protein PBRA_008281 [Plasmodiophora brassicae]SPQ95319.1 unnamed protein product [Plasmodiophora brassicae]
MGSHASKRAGATVVNADEKQRLLMPDPRDTAVETGPVAVVVDAAAAPVIRFGFGTAYPEDVFWHVFSFLTISDLVRLARVCSAWQNTVYSPYLWDVVDLYPFRFNVHTRLVDRLLSNARFAHLKSIHLDDCAAVDAGVLPVIARSCRQLRALTMIRCRQMHFERPRQFAQLRQFVFDVSSLDVLDVYGCCSASAIPFIVESLREIAPRLTFGLLQLYYCAITGRDLDGQPFQCRVAAGGPNFNGRACWGAVHGQLIFGNGLAGRHGNLPDRAVYSCVAHSDLESDIIDGRLGQCMNCTRMFDIESMFDAVRCRTCHDRRVLRDPSCWVALADAAAIDKFRGSQETVPPLCDVRNLPRSLCEVGRVPLGDEDDVRALLRRARGERGHSRALVTRVDGDVVVRSDRGYILRGAHGQLIVEVCLAVWSLAHSVVLPLFLGMLVVSWFSGVLAGTTAQGSASAAVSQSRDQSVQPTQLIVFIIIIVVIVAIIGLLLRRYRDQCISVLRRVLALDFFMIFITGGGLAVVLVFEVIGVPIDVISLCLFVFNAGAAGIIGIYFRGVPAGYRRCSMAGLNMLMAIIMLLTLNRILILILLLMPVGIDLYAQVVPRRHVALPLYTLLRSDDHPDGPDMELHNPAMHFRDEDDDEHVDPVHTRPVLSAPTDWIPKLTYQVGDVQMRLFDFIWYALLQSIPESTVSALALGLGSIIGAFCACVLIAPLFQRDLKPLPFAFAGVLIVEIIRIYLTDHVLAVLSGPLLSVP